MYVGMAFPMNSLARYNIGVPNKALGWLLLHVGLGLVVKDELPELSSCTFRIICTTYLSVSTFKKFGKMATSLYKNIDGVQ